MIRIPESQGLSDIEQVALPYRELPGFSAKLLSDHYKLYEGYIRRLEALEKPFRDAVSSGDKWMAGMISREMGFLRNAIILHELYFGNMTPYGKGRPLELHFDWEKEFRLLGSATTGWVVLAWCPRTKKPIIFTMKEHGQGYVAGTKPLLVMDVYDHSWMPQPGLDKDAYIDAFFRNINWDVVRQRNG
jgi:Fe-Mn family superoxide dismutase